MTYRLQRPIPLGNVSVQCQPEDKQKGFTEGVQRASPSAQSGTEWGIPGIETQEMALPGL